jgi:glycosyltransferase involved in cell wall biosynthesis
MMRTCALIPAFNEASHIAQVVEGAREHVETVIVIDDGSSDGTAELARNAGAFCIESPTNSAARQLLCVAA